MIVRMKEFGVTALAALAVLLPIAARAAVGPAPHPLLQSPARVNPKDGAQMVYVPAGQFLMGDADMNDNPRRKITLSGYWIYKNDVTVAQYRKFCTETGRQMPPAPDAAGASLGLDGQPPRGECDLG